MAENSAVVVSGISALGAGLYRIGIPKHSITQQESALKSDTFLVIAHGMQDEVARAKRILDASGAGQVAGHHGVSAA